MTPSQVEKKWIPTSDLQKTVGSPCDGFKDPKVSPRKFNSEFTPENRSTPTQKETKSSSFQPSFSGMLNFGGVLGENTSLTQSARWLA